MKLRNKIAFVSILLILFVTVSTQAFYYAYTFRQTMESTINASIDTSRLLSEYMDSRLRSVIRSVFNTMNADIFSFGQNSNFVRYMLSGNPAAYAAAVTEVSNELNILRLSNDFIASVYVHTVRGDFIDNTLVRKIDFDENSKSTNPPLGADQPGQYWGDREMESLYRYQSESIPLVLAFQPGYYNQLIHVVVALHKERILNYARNLVTFDEGNVFIYHRDTGNILMSINGLGVDNLTQDSFLRDTQGQSGPGYLKVQGKNDAYYLFLNDSAFSPWVTVTVRSQKEMFSSLTAATRVSVGIAAISAFMCIWAAIVLARSVTRPLQRLEKTMQKVSGKNFDIHFEYAKQDEIGALGRKFNFMIDEIKSLIGQLNETIHELEEEKIQVQKEQAQKRKAELKALQAQINPHFLYNTLNSIVWMAERAGAREIGQMSKALGAFFELSLNSGKEWLPLEKELLQAESYLSIQKMRYRDKLSYSIDCRTELKQVMCVKLIVQPLVENAIYHGIKEKEGIGKIWISAVLHENGEDILILVSDDGLGMSRKQIERLNEKLAHGDRAGDDGYGIFNINERIRLAFGPEYGLRYALREGGGTTVTIAMPKITANEVEMDV